MLKSKPLALKQQALCDFSVQIIVLDTNVLVSALLAAESFPAQVISLVRNRSVQARYCDAILAEYRDVLSRQKFNFQAEDVQKSETPGKAGGLSCEPPKGGYGCLLTLNSSS